MSMAWFNYGYTHARLVAYDDYNGYRNRFGGQDSNLDLNDDDMSRLQEIAPDWTYEYRRPVREDTRERGDRPQFEYDRAGELMERDYFEGLERSRDDPRYPDRYGWDQYAGGYDQRYPY
jgi:hypothetical protein